MLKKLMLFLTAVVAVSANSTPQTVRDIPQPPCWPCTSLK